MPKNILSIDLSGNSLGLFNLKTSATHITTLLLAQCSIDSWNTVIAISEAFPSLKNLRLSENPVYDSNSLARSVIIASFPYLEILNGASVSKPRLRTECERYCAWSEKVKGMLSSARLEILKQNHPREETALQTADGSRPTKKSSFIRVSLAVLDKKVEFKVLPSLTVAAFRRLVAKRSQWPMDLEDLAIAWVSGASEGQDYLLDIATKLEVTDEDTVGDIFCDEELVSLFLTVKS